jgi:hypothetical protein
MTLDSVIKEWARAHIMSIVPELKRRGSKWCVHINEQWPTVDDSGSYIPDTALHNRIVEWATPQLEFWPNCKRMSYDMWYFDRKQDAEKFITLYHLKWAK